MQRKGGARGGESAVYSRRSLEQSKQNFESECLSDY